LCMEWALNCRAICIPSRAAQDVRRDEDLGLQAAEGKAAAHGLLEGGGGGLR
jgi:hypothetical protein